MNRVMQIRRSSAVLLTIIAVMAGALAYSWTSARRIPIFVSAAHAASVEPFSGGSFASIAKSTMPAVVNISTTQKVKVQNPFGGGGDMEEGPFGDFFRQFFGGRVPQMPRERIAHALGSGVVISPDGYILTNNHVVEGATDIKVSFANQREMPAKLIGRDAATDVAVVKVDQRNLPTLPLGDSSHAEVGDIVLAIGNPFGIGQTVTMGIVSAKGRALGIEGLEDMLQTDAAINPGNSGGALVNTRGELIGINTAIIGGGEGVGGEGGNVGIGFAIPVNLARNVMNQLMKGGKVTRGYLGVGLQAITPGEEQAFGLRPGQSGVAISEVLSPDSPGAKAGLQVGDVVVGVNGTPITDVNSLRLQIAGMAPGSRADLKIIRNGQEMNVPVTLGESHLFDAARGARGNNQGPGGGPGENGSQSALPGVQTDTLNADTAAQLKLPSHLAGVVVTSVDEGSAAGEAGLQEGDIIQRVNHQKVTSPSEFDSAVHAAGNRQLLLLVYRTQEGQGRNLFIVIQPNNK